MELNDYSWFIYALTLMLTLSICFIIILIIVKCAETCYETRMFCCKKQRNHRHRHRRGNRRSRTGQCQTRRSSQSLSSNNSESSYDNSSMSSSSSVSSSSRSSLAGIEATSPTNSNLMMHQSGSVLNMDHSSVVFIPNIFYSNMAFEDINNNESPANSNSNTKINRKYDDKARHVNKLRLKSTLPTSVAMHHQSGNLSTISNGVECFHRPQSALIAIDLNQTRLKCSPSLNHPTLACINLNGGFLVNAGATHILNADPSAALASSRFLPIQSGVAGTNGDADGSEGTNSEKLLDDELNALLNETETVACEDLSLRLEDEEVPPPYDFVIRESIV